MLAPVCEDGDSRRRPAYPASAKYSPTGLSGAVATRRLGQAPGRPQEAPPRGSAKKLHRQFVWPLQQLLLSGDLAQHSIVQGLSAEAGL